MKSARVAMYGRSRTICSSFGVRRRTISGTISWTVMESTTIAVTATKLVRSWPAHPLRQHGDRHGRGCDPEQKQTGKQPLMIDVGEHPSLSASPDHQLVRLEPVAPHRDEEQQRGQSAQVSPHSRAHPDSGALPPEARSERIEANDDDRHSDDQQHRPGVHGLLERQPRRVERQVALDVWVALPEPHSETRELERRPARERGHHRCGDPHRQQERKPVEVLSRDCLAELDVRQPTRQRQGPDASAERGQIHEGDEDRDDRADAVDQQEVARPRGPERGRAHRRVPGVIGVESGKRASADQ